MKEIKSKKQIIQNRKNCSCGCCCDEETLDTLSADAHLDNQDSYADCSCQCQDKDEGASTSVLAADIFNNPGIS